MNLSQSSLHNHGYIDASRTWSYNHMSMIDNRVDNSVNNSVNHTTIHQNLYHSTEGSKRKAVLKWLSELNFWVKHLDVASRREPGTGQWLLENPIFVEWRDGIRGQRTLLCHGIPGAGKTILTSLTIDHIEETFRHDRAVGIAYVYCDYKEQHEQTKFNVTGNLLVQFLATITDEGSEAYQAVYSLYDKYTSSHILRQPSQAELSSILQKLVVTAFKRVFVVVDALDELVVDERNGLLTEIKCLAGLGVRVFITSRSIREITEKFNTKDDIQLEISPSSQDIKAYLEGQIQRKPELLSMTKRDPMLAPLIITTLLEKAQGMFLLARLHLETVAAANSYNEVRYALRNLPTALDDTYDDAVERIRQQESRRVNLARRVLTWITYSLRPLTFQELQYALAVKVADNTIDEGDLIWEEKILSCCTGLVVLDPGSNCFRLVHYTAQIYFQRPNLQFLSGPPSPHIQIASTCLQYLSFTQIPSSFNSISELPTLVPYAGRHWGRHVRGPLAQIDAVLLKGQVMDLLKDRDQLRKLSIVERNVHDTIPGPSCGSFGDIPLHVAAYYRLEEIVEVLLSIGEGPNVKCGYPAVTALGFAAAYGDIGIARMVLESGGDIEATHCDLAPVFLAAHGGHEEIVRLLLEKGAILASSYHYNNWLCFQRSTYTLTMRVTAGYTPLFTAASNGYVGVVRLLLDKVIDTASENEWKERSLCEALRNGHKDVVRLMLERGISFEFRGELRQHPFTLAASNGHEAVVQLLLKNAKSDCEWKRSYGVAALYAAAGQGHAAVVRLMLEGGVNVNSTSFDNYKQTPLYVAAMEGHESVVRLLLEMGANIESSNREGKTPLYAAAEGSHESVVRLLLEKGANVEVTATNNARPSFIAAYEAHDYVVRLGEGFRRTTNYHTPLSIAVERGNEGVVRLLLEKGGVLEWKDSDGKTPLHTAAKHGHEGVVRLFLGKGAILEWEDSNWKTPLYTAAQHGHEGVVRLLLEKGANLDCKDNNQNTPLHAAAKHGHEGIVRLLLEKGANLDCKDSNQNTPLHAAAKHGHEGIVRLLLEKGANFEWEDIQHRHLHRSKKRRFGEGLW